MILGVDPGTHITGYGVIAKGQGKWKAIDYGCIKPPKSMKLSERYLEIHYGIDQLIETYAPEVLVVETQFVHKNVQSAIKLGMARGVILLSALRKGVKVVEYAPAKAKKAVVGRGNATKAQVQSMTQRLLELEEIPEPEDAADALMLALCHAFAFGNAHLLGVEI